MRVRMFIGNTEAPVRDIKGVKAMVQTTESAKITLEMSKGGGEIIETDPAAENYVAYDVVRVTAQ